MTDVAAMLAALRADPLDELTYLALADALEEAGRECEANRYRRGKPCVPDVYPAFLEYARRNPCWGSLHVVLEDDNHDDDSVKGCIDWADVRDDVEGARLARVLLRMSPTQRGRIANLVSAWLCGTLRWEGRPGRRNAPVEVDHARDGPYYFSLCRRQEAEDPYEFHVFVYRDDLAGGGYQHVRGCATQDHARVHAAKWLAKERGAT